jgi:hypothetical protein
MTRWLVLVIAALALLPGIASASAPAQHPVARGVYAPQTDNQGWVAWSPDPPNYETPPAPGRVVVLEEATGRRATVVLPRTCAFVYVPDGSHGRFLIDCSEQSRSVSHTFVLDARTLRVREVPGAKPCLNYDRIGRYWLEGVDCNSVHRVVVFTDWRFGGAPTTDGNELGEIRPPRDLDTPGLRQAGPATSAFALDGRYLFETRPRGLVLRRPGHAEGLLSRCTFTCSPIAVRAGLAVWLDRGATFAYIMRTRRAVSWRLPASSGVVGVTARRVYTARPNGNYGRVDLASFRWRR